MSKLSFLFVLLCISLHACNARPLGEVEKEHEKKFLLPNKNDEKMKPALPKEPGVAINGKSMKEQSRVGKEDDHKPEITKAKKSVKDHDESLLPSVSWRLPHRKPGVQQPEFNSDYSPPKTHPPVHN